MQFEIWFARFLWSIEGRKKEYLLGIVKKETSYILSKCVFGHDC